MRVVAQRVSSASVTVEGEVVGQIAHGLLLLVGVAPDDTTADCEAMANKLAGLRIFADDQGHMNRDVLESGGSVLAVSQFTLLADTRKGRRPSFIRAAPPEQAEPMFEVFVSALRARDLSVATGRFGANMAVELVNDGPVTIVLESVDGKLV